MHVWLKAAERYKASKRKGFRPRKKKEKPPRPTLAEFLASAEGKAARKLLAAAGTYILLGESEKCMGRTTSVSFDGKGLKKSNQMTGVAAAYSKEKPNLETISADQAVDLVTDFGIDCGDDLNADYVLVEKIRAECDELAANAP